jgi:hypothetical protein
MERVWSFAGQVTTPQQFSLKDSSIRDRVVLYTNQKEQEVYSQDEIEENYLTADDLVPEQIKKEKTRRKREWKSITENGYISNEDEEDVTTINALGGAYEGRPSSQHSIDQIDIHDDSDTQSVSSQESDTAALGKKRKSVDGDDSDELQEEEVTPTKRPHITTTTKSGRVAGSYKNVI